MFLRVGLSFPKAEPCVDIFSMTLTVLVLNHYSLFYRPFRLYPCSISPSREKGEGRWKGNATFQQETLCCL